MKYLISFFVAAILAGCDRTPDASQNPASGSGIGNETTAAATAPESSTETQTAEENVVPSGRVIRAGIFKAVHEGRLLEDTRQQNVSHWSRVPTLASSTGSPVCPPSWRILRK